MEFADGKTRLTRVVVALSMTDQQEADKLLGDPFLAMSALFPTPTTRPLKLHSLSKLPRLS